MRHNCSCTVLAQLLAPISIVVPSHSTQGTMHNMPQDTVIISGRLKVQLLFANVLGCSQDHVFQ